MKSRMLRMSARKSRKLLARVLKLSVSVSLVPILLAIATGATTLVVGTCKPGAYSTIQQAINAAPVGATVQVCPGNYPEQVTITQGVTLQGLTANNGDQALISLPTLPALNALDLFGDPVVAQILVTNAAGPVNISNLWVGGNGSFTASGLLFAGIYYQNSPGTISSVLVNGQSGNRLGIGIFLEGGASSPSVTVQNSSLSGIDYAAIDFETVGFSNTALTAKITNNFVLLDIVSNNPAGIQFGAGTTATVSGNSVLGSGNASGSGIVIGTGAIGSVTGNSVMSTGSGIQTYADGTSVSSNKLSRNGFGIDLRTAIGAVKSNIIIGPNVGIAFNCKNNPHVLSNTINYSTWGFTQVLTALSTSTNKVYNTQIIRSGTCS